MATFPVTVTAQVAPGIEVSGVNISYEELVNSLGAYYYLIRTMFLQASSNSQLSQNLQFIEFDSSGNRNIEVVSPDIDPYQVQKSMLLDLKRNGFIIASRMVLGFMIMANSWIQFTFHTKRGYLAEMGGLISNAKRLKGV